MEGLCGEQLDERRYRLRGPGWTGEVPPGLMKVAVDYTEYGDPSSLLSTVYRLC